MQWIGGDVVAVGVTWQECADLSLFGAASVAASAEQISGHGSFG